MKGKGWRDQTSSVELVPQLLADYSAFKEHPLTKQAAQEAMEAYIKADLEDFPGQQEDMGEWSLPLCYWMDGFKTGLKQALEWLLQHDASDTKLGKTWRSGLKDWEALIKEVEEE